ncbi:MAG: hypothetical protein M1825_004128 [Sarcosagium campestre]|nr:MAG: hypothetical protein M1825_004128 [Sarcosagium campestre]
MNGKGYGMPSSHAQFVAFFSVSLSLFLLLRHRPTPTTTRTPTTLTTRAVLAALSCIGAAAVAGSRIYLSYHTPKQVLVGSIAGIVSALLWFLVTAALRRSGLLLWLLDLPAARMLRMRDLVVVEDLVDAGWVRWESKRHSRIEAHGELVNDKIDDDDVGVKQKHKKDKKTR